LTTNPTYMMDKCKKSCNNCPSCKDSHQNCQSWASSGYCSGAHSAYMSQNCKASCGLCQDCVDNNSMCSSWASRGECSRNPVYMLVQCKKSCNQCSGGGGTTPKPQPGTNICSRLPAIYPSYPAYGYGTIFGVFRPTILSSDSSKYLSTSPNGRGNRNMFSRTLGRFYWTNAYLYNVRFSDQSHAVEFRVDPRLGSGYNKVVHYARVLGRTPKFTRARVYNFDIAPGSHPQAGGGSYELKTLHIELDYARTVEASGSLEEMLMHEAGHVSLQNLQSTAAWQRAAAADGNHISIYARNNPGREDVTESIIPWFATRCRTNRFSQRDLQTICSAIPNRLAYLDSLFGTDCNNM